MSRHLPLPSRAPTPRQWLTYFLSVWICPLQTLHINETKQYAHSLCVQFLSLSLMFSRFIYILACISASFILTAKWYSIEHRDHIPFMHSSADRRLGSFHSLTIMNSAVLMCVHTCVGMFSSLLCLYLGVEFLGHKKTLCITFWGTSRQSKEGFPDPPRLRFPLLICIFSSQLLLLFGSRCDKHINDLANSQLNACISSGLSMPSTNTVQPLASFHNL